MYVAQTIWVGNVDIIKRTGQFKTLITLHYRKSALIVSVPALYLYLTTISLLIKFLHHHRITFKACFPLPRVGLG